MLSSEKTGIKEDTRKDIAVILAIRNEVRHIDVCIQSLINQDYSRDKYEIIIVDGMSDDGTREIIYPYVDRFPDMFKIYNNPSKTAPYGRNIGINAASSDWVLIFGGHCKASRNLISTLARARDKVGSEVAGIGSVHVAPDDETYFGKIVHEVQSSMLGGLGTSFNSRRDVQYVKSTAFTLYRKKTIVEIGLHDVRFTIGQDMDLNWRIRQAGYKIVLCRDAIVYYYRRHANTYSMTKRMYAYGKWKAIFFRSHAGSFEPIYIFPSLILLLFIALPLSSVVSPFLLYLAVYLIVVYFAALVLNSIFLSVKNFSFRYLVCIPIYLLEHLSFGMGFFIGILDNSSFQKNQEDVTVQLMKRPFQKS